ncbi:helix-turn-helix domain-containing protein [Haloechinothrix sp. YIM 98757]|uniref:Helix-turn-helix domain-containing protein n=1 Tax=Haloechinothrix aidingensis TaxID=2752311 RepID=A0A838A656_9PSEU|nr:helix-turn-helix domain-containing protein [Haloechinothrix aidingensis]MBA0125290.1 helix-turn-helix domain-containing protein [Haloechinothrix aidingensis]
MRSVRSVVDRVGPTLLHTVSLPDADRPVGDVVIAEGHPHARVAAGDLVLAVLGDSVETAVGLVHTCGANEAAAVLCKPRLAQDAEVRKAARSAGVGLIEVHADTSWAQLVWLLRTVLDAIADEADATDDTQPEAADLFRLADAAASVVDAPVTIEDINSRVLAYSARQDLTDPARVSTIMDRRIPDDVLARFRSRGVFRELSRGRQTIYVPEQKDGTLPRLIVPVRMGGELLGSMWAVVDGPVSEERAAAFADAAPVVAVHLLRRRAHANTQRHANAELLRAVLEGRASPRRAAAELGLTDADHRVVAVATSRQQGEGDEELGAEGLRLALLERLSAGIGNQTRATEFGGLLYLVVPDGGWAALRDTLATEPGCEQGWLRAAAGTAAPVGELARSRGEAEEALGLVRAGLVPGAVIGFDEVWTALALHRVATAAGSAGAVELGPLEVLTEHDRRQHSDYVDTLYAWLRHQGDPRATARELSIHPNTLRYRLRKLLNLTGLDLEDPETRLALLAQLITLRWS